MLFTVNGRVSPAAKYLPRADRLRRLTAKEVQDCFQHLCRDSVFAYEEELRQGFFTIRGGCRVGVAVSYTHLDVYKRQTSSSARDAAL